MNRTEWIKARKRRISGTFASAIIGQNPYMNNQDAFDIITGGKESEDISEKPFVKYGIKAEKPLVELFKLDFPEYKVKTKKYDLRIHPEYPFLVGSIDGELTDAEGKKGVLEIKTTNILQSMQQEKWENNSVPQNYFIQVLHYLIVTGFDFAVLKAQLKTVWKDEIRLNIKHYFFKREEFQKDIDYLKEKEIYFWNENVLKNKRPGLILPQI